mmetsp:Transcript_18948/g.54598  ORF Transcript_18948/g.54598 Transcript_18948/m.54598 type:complete len:97 (-) Transcript_18948:86-376(-)
MSYNAAILARRLTGEKYDRHERDDDASSLSSSSTSSHRGKTSTRSNEECEMFARQIAKSSDLPVECKEIKNKPIVATSSSMFYVPTWEYMDDYSGA